jgi:ribosomal-protein-alanine N-acetyltransferase
VPVLGGPQLTLRELQHEDAASLCAHLTTEEVTRFISPPPTNVEGFEKFIRWTHTRRAQGRFLCFGIVPAGQTRAVGFIQINLSETDGETAEWGFVLGAAFWGTGLFLQAARLMFDFAFGALGVHRLEARSVQTDARGNAVLRKLGARRDGILREAFHRDGKFRPYIMWSILAPEWSRTRKKLLSAP